MKGLKQIRLVYRQHLLPPIILPFKKITDYLKLFTDTNSLANETECQQLKRMTEIHQTVMTQLNKIRNSYIIPLKSCPFLYQQLDLIVRNRVKSDPSSSNHYDKIIHTLSIQERLKMNKKIKKDYYHFKQNMQNQDLDFFKKVLHVPVFIYQSPRDLAEINKKQWEQLSQFQRYQIIQEYEKKLQKHWQSLKQIAQGSSLSIEELLEAVQTQINPPLSTQLKNILFT